ncbi:hybrid sensor histidine kinase/response regulator, partial [Escherichia coli]|nr:hybrid sensor histidine kinase/response regulator [Escherichia coli]
EALAERAVLADIVNGSEAFVQVVDMEGRWIAVNNAAMAEFERIFGVQPQIGMRQVDLLEGHVHQDKLREVWARALVEDGYSDIIQYEASDGALHFY